MQNDIFELALNTETTNKDRYVALLVLHHVEGKLPSRVPMTFSRLKQDYDITVDSLEAKLQKYKKLGIIYVGNDKEYKLKSEAKDDSAVHTLARWFYERMRQIRSDLTPSVARLYPTIRHIVKRDGSSKARAQLENFVTELQAGRVKVGSNLIPALMKFVKQTTTGTLKVHT